jgi:hypothetical protein
MQKRILVTGSARFWATDAKRVVRGAHRAQAPADLSASAYAADIAAARPAN